MRELTKAILDLKLFEPLNIDESKSNDWRDADYIMLLKNPQARLVLRIEDQRETAESHKICLDIEQTDLNGGVYTCDTIWSASGEKSEVISEFQNETWNEERLRAYSKLLA